MPQKVNCENDYLGMCHQDREAIKNNLDILAREANLPILLQKLGDYKVFSPRMMQYYTSLENNFENRKKIFFNITKRGPEAFSFLCISLKETNQAHLANALNPVQFQNLHIKEINGNQGGIVPFQLPPGMAQKICNIDPYQNRTINLSQEPAIIKVKCASVLKDRQDLKLCYQTHSRNRGQVLLINIKNFRNPDKVRKGSEVDVKNLNELFTQIGMEVHTASDLTEQDFKTVIRSFVKNPKLKESDMMIIFIMSHGEVLHNCECVQTADQKFIPTTWVEDHFYAKECPFMVDKPKMLFYQICRGGKLDFGLQTTHFDGATSLNYSPHFVPKIVPSLSDVLVVHATTPGYKSHRDIYLGTWFVDKLCKVFMEYAWDESVNDLIIRISEEVKNLQSEKYSLQVVHASSTGFKRCYLNPGIYLSHDDRIEKFGTI